MILKNSYVKKKTLKNYPKKFKKSLKLQRCAKKNMVKKRRVIKNKLENSKEPQYIVEAKQILVQIKKFKKKKRHKACFKRKKKETNRKKRKSSLLKKK